MERTSDVMVINMGPQHPSTHGVLRVELKTDGEVILEATPHLGYLHRDFEKHCEAVLWGGVIPYTDRMDYVAAMNNNFGYCLAVEKLLGTEIPERASVLRVLVSELNRIASHLLAFGTYGIDIGAFTPFLYAFREREMILDLFEHCCGARLTYNYIRIGGVSRDLPPEFEPKCRRLVRTMREAIPEYNNLLSYNQIFVARTRDIGVIPAELAIAWGCTGPVLRGSGVKWDLRKDEPYSIYPELQFEVPVGKGEVGTVGDCWDRYMVRLREMEQSVDLVEQCLDRLKPGPVMAKGTRSVKPPKGEVYHRTETPRGELGFYIVSDGGKKAYRCKVRSPCFCNLSILSEIAPGHLIADMVALIGSIDIVLGEVDR
ncbi:MAG: NADH-quinone oxidoreductase subunit D [Planctomycetes bacterium]|nr:NADH-quinone oxidoreductase subunit D [Planctomycetota bacterium]